MPREGIDSVSHRQVFREEIRNAIREAIFSGKLNPGDRIIETYWAKELGVSQGPVREAIRDLEDILFSDPYEEECPIRDLGTLGGGNHFAEFQCVEQIYDRDSIRYTGLKSRVVCHDTNLLFAEAPEAYKNVEQVIGVLQEYGLIDIAATLRPLITFKG